MPLFIASMVLILIALVVLCIGLFVKDYNGDRQIWPFMITGLVSLVAFVMLGFATTTIVPARQVGIPVTFGVAGNAMPNGFNLKAPWTDVELMPTTPQALDAVGDKATKAKDVDNSDVFVYNNVRWSIVEKQAASIYYDAKDFDNVSDMFIQPSLRTAVATVMSTYAPLSDKKPGNAEVADAIKAELQKRVGDRFTIDSVNVTFIDVSQATKDRIAALNAERANTRIAEQKEQTAAAEARANKILADSIKNDPNVLTANCIKAITESPAGTFPAGFQCFAGASGSVVIPAVK